MSLKVKLYIILAIIVLIIVIISYKKISAKIATRRAEREFRKNQIAGTVGGQPYSLNAASVANEIYDAFHNACLWGACEDEEKAILAINNVPKEFIPMVSEAYYNLYKKNLNQEFVKYLDAGDCAECYNKVKAKFN